MTWKDKGDKIIINIFIVFILFLFSVSIVKVIISFLSEILVFFSGSESAAPPIASVPSPAPTPIVSFTFNEYFYIGLIIIVIFSLILSIVFWIRKKQFITLSEFLNQTMCLTTVASSLCFLIFELRSLARIISSFDQLVVLGLGPIALIWLSVKGILDVMIIQKEPK